MEDKETTEATPLVSSTDISVRIGGQKFGADVDIELKETITFNPPVDQYTAVARNNDAIELLTAQVVDQLRDAVTFINETAAAYTEQHPVAVVQATQAQGTQAGRTAPEGTGRQAVQAVANGAEEPSVQGNLTWGKARNSGQYGDDFIKYLTTDCYSVEQLAADVAAWLRGQGLNPDNFKVWDERIGKNGAEAGGEIECPAGVKLVKDLDVEIPRKSGFKANFKAFRVYFNNDGSLHITATKQFDAWLKDGARTVLG